jgi:class 3 adenylate cyclase
MSAATAEYKHVTVLFADVVRSMDIAAAVGVERLREIMAAVVGRSTSAVQRYGGTVEFTGDGVMAVFGAPVAFEDHAIRACLAALAIQNEASRIAVEVADRDPVQLRLRVGLNSGQVIAGEIGPAVSGYHTVGRHVGMAQRMESAAPPGAVLLSESTARLVEHAAVLGEPENVQVKGSDDPVRGRRLLAMQPRRAPARGCESRLVGRRTEAATIEAAIDGAIKGRGAVLAVVGPPGIGKSRLARDAATAAAGRGAEVLWAFCESHSGNVPFHVVTHLLRDAAALVGRDGRTARDQLRSELPSTDDEDLLLVDDLLGVAGSNISLPKIDPDARRRQLSAQVHTALAARSDPRLYIIEDAQWIDEVSESMLADFLTNVADIPQLTLLTYRPEYQGALTRLVGLQTITLEPLDDSDISTLLSELLGTDPSIVELTAKITERAAGNPFFGEEMVRELAQRGVLAGSRGDYVCRTDVANIDVPATVQATIATHIDHLGIDAKQTVLAASVIGSRFGTDLLDALVSEPALEELITAQLIDEICSIPVEYNFRHPLIRAVAYESQLKSQRAQLHRRLAAAIESADPGAADQNSALIAQHYESAGEAHIAYSWHMRAASWSTLRDISAARLSWERARDIADALPVADTARITMRIAPRTMLSLSVLRVRDVASGFAELRELCSAADDKVSLAVGMTGLGVDLLLAGRARQAARLASEQMALIESIGDPALTIGLTPYAVSMLFDTGEVATILRWSQRVIDLAAGDRTTGASFGFGSPLAVTLASRGTARWWLGHPGWRRDLDEAEAMARNGDPATLAAVVTYKYGWTIFYRVLRPEDAVVHALEETVRTAEASSDDTALGIVKLSLAGALLHRDSVEDHQRGRALLSQVREMWLSDRSHPYGMPLVDIYAAREDANGDNRDAAIEVMRDTANELHHAGRIGFGVWGVGVLVETLLARGTQADVAEAQTAVDRLANLSPAGDLAILDIWLLRLRALLARARGEDVAYRHYRDHYRNMAAALGFEGHLAMAEEL